MNKPMVISILFVSFAVIASASAETAKEKCIRAAQAKLASCLQALPPNVKPKDPKKPTEEEKEAMSKYTKASKQCNEQGKNDMMACN